MQENPIDILIIGAGPAGLSAAINGVARGKSVRLFSLGQSNLDKAEWVDNYLGFPHISGKDLMKAFIDHALFVGVPCERQRVGALLPLGEGQGFMATVGQEVLQAGTVILAIGTASSPPYPGEGEFLGKGVSYCATCDGMLYRNKDVVVADLSAEATQEANFLQEIGCRVTFLSRKERPSDLREDISYRKGSIIAIEGESSVARIKTMEDALPTTGVFLLRDAIAPASLLPDLAMDGPFIKVDRAQMTNLPGLFAAGDCTGKPLQIANAVGDGLVAAQNAAKYVDQTNPLYSLKSQS